MENLYKSKKFWIIWYSCLESPRSIKEIHQLWNYSEGSKALYQPAGTGHENSIGEEMIQEGFLEVDSEEKTRGATAKMLDSKTKWYTEYIKDKALESLSDDRKPIMEKDWENFEDALTNQAFRGVAFDIEALKEALPSKTKITNENDMIPFVMYMYLMHVSVAYEYVDDNIPMNTKKVITSGMMGLNSLANDMTGSSIAMGNYLEKLIENHGLESIVDSVPEETVESEMYEEIEDSFEEQMKQVQNMLGA